MQSENSALERESEVRCSHCFVTFANDLAFASHLPCRKVPVNIALVKPETIDESENPCTSQTADMKEERWSCHVEAKLPINMMKKEEGQSFAGDEVIIMDNIKKEPVEVEDTPRVIVHPLETEPPSDLETSQLLFQNASGETSNLTLPTGQSRGRPQGSRGRRRRNGRRREYKGFFDDSVAPKIIPKPVALPAPNSSIIVNNASGMRIDSVYYTNPKMFDKGSGNKTTPQLYASQPSASKVIASGPGVGTLPYAPSQPLLPSPFSLGVNLGSPVQNVTGLLPLKPQTQPILNGPLNYGMPMVLGMAQSLPNVNTNCPAIITQSQGIPQQLSTCSIGLGQVYTNQAPVFRNGLPSSNPNSLHMVSPELRQGLLMGNQVTGVGMAPTGQLGSSSSSSSLVVHARPVNTTALATLVNSTTVTMSGGGKCITTVPTRMKKILPATPIQEIPKPAGSKQLLTIGDKTLNKTRMRKIAKKPLNMDNNLKPLAITKYLTSQVDQTLNLQSKLVSRSSLFNCVPPKEMESTGVSENKPRDQSSSKYCPLAKTDSEKNVFVAPNLSKTQQINGMMEEESKKKASSIRKPRGRRQKYVRQPLGGQSKFRKLLMKRTTSNATSTEKAAASTLPGNEIQVSSVQPQKSSVSTGTSQNPIFGVFSQQTQLPQASLFHTNYNIPNVVNVPGIPGMVYVPQASQISPLGGPMFCPTPQFPSLGGTQNMWLQNMNGNMLPQISPSMFGGSCQIPAAASLPVFMPVSGSSSVLGFPASNFGLAPTSIPTQLPMVLNSGAPLLSNQALDQLHVSSAQNENTVKTSGNETNCALSPSNSMSSAVVSKGSRVGRKNFDVRKSNTKIVPLQKASKQHHHKSLRRGRTVLQLLNESKRRRVRNRKKSPLPPVPSTAPLQIKLNGSALEKDSEPKTVTGKSQAMTFSTSSSTITDVGVPDDSLIEPSAQIVCSIHSDFTVGQRPANRISKLPINLDLVKTTYATPILSSNFYTPATGLLRKQLSTVTQNSMTISSTTSIDHKRESAGATSSALSSLYDPSTGLLNRIALSQYQGCDANMVPHIDSTTKDLGALNLPTNLLESKTENIGDAAHPNVFGPFSVKDLTCKKMAPATSEEGDTFTSKEVTTAGSMATSVPTASLPKKSFSALAGQKTELPSERSRLTLSSSASSEDPSKVFTAQPLYPSMFTKLAKGTLTTNPHLESLFMSGSAATEALLYPGATRESNVFPSLQSRPVPVAMFSASSAKAVSRPQLKLLPTNEVLPCPALGEEKLGPSSVFSPPEEPFDLSISKHPVATKPSGQTQTMTIVTSSAESTCSIRISTAPSVVNTLSIPRMAERLATLPSSETATLPLLCLPEYSPAFSKSVNMCPSQPYRRIAPKVNFKILVPVICKNDVAKVDNSSPERVVLKSGKQDQGLAGLTFAGDLTQLHDALRPSTVVVSKVNLPEPGSSKSVELLPASKNRLVKRNVACKSTGPSVRSYKPNSLQSESSTLANKSKNSDGYGKLFSQKQTNLRLKQKNLVCHSLYYREKRRRQRSHKDFSFRPSRCVSPDCCHHSLKSYEFDGARRSDRINTKPRLNYSELEKKNDELENQECDSDSDPETQAFEVVTKNVHCDSGEKVSQTTEEEILEKNGTCVSNGDNHMSTQIEIHSKHRKPDSQNDSDNFSEIKLTESYVSATCNEKESRDSKDTKYKTELGENVSKTELGENGSKPPENNRNRTPSELLCETSQNSDHNSDIYYSSESESDLLPEASNQPQMTAAERQKLMLRRHREVTMFLVKHAEKFTSQEDTDEHFCKVCGKYKTNGIFKLGNHLKKHIASSSD